eukprot:CAMPEP_0196770556 /NCGR_PEP_ID=MMETSP1104-20130614/1205_1 /TAXON_ID=33652 /ORGANISM="Cafeteria sp., Strain Caron Lab Isolate" /LENGTH=175 /DNA_ID=CAMNT_0042140669 /DNA_START=34 /DNA_END=561 /DNA_ORIENTATION=+
MPGLGNPRNIMLGLNGLISVATAVVVICSFVTAGTKFTGGGKLDDAVGFLAVTTMLLLVVTNVLTYIVVLRRKSATAVSYITALTHFQIVIQLNNAVLFGGMNDVHSEGVYRADAAFGAILFVLYLVKAAILFRFRVDLVEDDFIPSSGGHGDDTFAPPVTGGASDVYSAPASSV